MYQIENQRWQLGKAKSFDKLVVDCLALMINVILAALLGFAIAKGSREACFIVKNKIR
ncbi:TPA: hypothetical protein TVN69_000128 [Streptococcus equi subsp. zooepidemicus]|nr:hypothetical protein [Streptococcus equi subsp. zooepidemicus]HEL1228998.1 hypothetical protein [Streptococcus equi subsp. zooepidemicus]